MVIYVNSFILIILLGSMLLIVILLSNKSVSLNSIKSKTVGDGQHGTARFATDKEVKKAYSFVKYDVNSWRENNSRPKIQGIILGYLKKGNNHYALVDDTDTHTLMIASAGSGKTAYFLYPNLEYACASGMSFFCTDTKGDLYRNYASIAKDYYGYNISVIDLRNPLESDHFNMLHLVNKYMDIHLKDSSLDSKSKAEKYAKIISKTIISSEDKSYGQNQFFYDSAESLLTAVILILAEFGEKDERHIVSVFKLIQDLSEHIPNTKTMKIKELIKKLPDNHKAKWFAGSALNTSDASIYSILSTALSRLNSFIDSELEQTLCFDTAIDAEKFYYEKSAIFVVLPEEDNTKYFIASLIIQQLYREILSVYDEGDKQSKRRMMFYLDEIGTIPPIDSIEMMFSAARSRGISIVAIIQSLAQLEKNYGKEGTDIIVENCKNTIAGGFAPISNTADLISKSLGNKTVLSGSISKGKNQESQSMQMIERPLMTTDELRSMNKGDFIVIKEGTKPIKTNLPLFLNWGVRFNNKYIVESKLSKNVKYVDTIKLLGKFGISDKEERVQIKI